MIKRKQQMVVSRMARSPTRRSSCDFRLLRNVRLLLLSVLIAAPAFAAGAEEAQPLRFCADPTNLPFSSDNSAQPGLYLEIGQAVAGKLGRPVAYDWHKSYFGKRTVRETLLSRRCDAMIGLPLVDDFMGPAVIFSRPIGREGYGLVSSSGRKIASIDDLKGLRVAVQYESNPQNLLALHDDIEKVTVLSPDEGMKALDQGRVDVAFIWAPVAGWLNKTVYGGKYQIVLTEGDGLLWQTAIGFGKGSSELRDAVNAALPGLQSEIDGLFAKYGVPNGAPLKFGELDKPKTTLAAASDQAAITSTGDARKGREVFNGTCAHCHGPDAVQAERHIDLRLLKKRYGNDMEATFWKTVHEGRPSKGMPSWKGIFSDEDLGDVYAYLLTVQQDSSSSN